MLQAFVDESERDELFYFLGAIVCTPQQGAFITSAYDEILQKHSTTFPCIDPSTELHANEILAGRGLWKKVPLRARFRIYHETLQVISASGACVHIEGIDRARHTAKNYKYPTPARELAFSHLYERLNDCATKKNQRVEVFADDHHTKEVSRSNFANYQMNGTYGYKSSPLGSIEAKISFIDSQTSRVLQAADMATYIFNRRKTIVEKDPRAAEEKILLWRDLMPAVSRGNSRVWP